MSNITTFAPTFALSIGTKAAPRSFVADRIGVALTNGKNGKEARTATKADMPMQAVNGGFHTFSGYLAATFPAAVAAFDDAVKLKLEDYQRLLKGETDPDVVGTLQSKIDRLTAAGQSVTNREGFNTFVQCILVWAEGTPAKEATAKRAAVPAKPRKMTAAQQEAMGIVLEYVRLIGERSKAQPAQ